MGVRLMLLGIVGRPAAAGWRMPAITANVNAKRQPKLLGAGIDRPVAMAAERLVGPRRHIDLNILPELGAALDLSDRRLGVVLPDQDRGFQPRLASGPVGELPLVDGALDRRAEIKILLREDKEIEHLQYPEFDIERVEVLL